MKTYKLPLLYDFFPEPYDIEMMGFIHESDINPSYKRGCTNHF
jgi:hypothetical protein